MFKLKTLTDYSDEALFAELRRVVFEFQGQRLTVKKFNELSRVHSSTIQKRFGSFTTALAQAGVNQEIPSNLKRTTREQLVEAIRAYTSEFPGRSVTVDEIATQLGIHRSTILHKFGKWADLLNGAGMKPVPSGRRYSDEECFENIVALWTRHGRQPHFAELNQPPSMVGSKAYVLRWGGWRAALAAFIDYINQQPQPSQDSPAERRGEPETRHDAVDPINSSQAFAPRSISLALRYKILSRDRFRCSICGRSPAKDPSVELHVDHIIPWSKSGTNSPDNLRALCFHCNLGKGAKIET